MKKVLSWVLVLALVLGSFSMAFAGDTDNASNFKDAAQIKNVEAVDVMVATGIIGGYPDGNFYPEKTVTRAEMAKMICIAVNGGEDVGSYYASSCKFADSKDHWAAGYIAYCANEGIIDGRSEDVFDPDATVTGTEAAKMMLVAIGYDSKIEKLTGEQWAANVLKLAKANDLFDGCDDFAAGAPLTRDNAAQIIFNGLQAEMVDYIFDAEITTGDTTVTVNTKVQGLDEALYEDAFDGDLVKADSKADGFGRPAHTWTLEKDEIGTYADEADYTFVVTDDDSLEAALDAYDEDLCDEFYGTSADKTVSSAVNNGDEFDTLWLGDVVELFDLDTVTNEKDNYKAVVLTYELGTIEEVDKEVSDKDAKDGVSAYVTIDGVTLNDTDIPGYDAKTYVEDAVIAVAWDYANDDEVLDSYVPEKVTGELTKYYSDSTYIDGTKYNNGTDWNASTLTIGNEYDFYFVNDYIYEAVEVTDNNPYSYAIYLGYKVDEGYSDDDDVYSVKLFTAEGKTETYTLNSDSMEEGAIRQPDANDLIAYTVNDDNEIDFIKIATGSAFDKEMKTNGILNGKKVAEDVVAFSYDGEDWSTNDYDDLKAAESVDAATYLMNRDGDEMAAIKLATPLEDTTTDVYGFITDVDRNAKNADKKDIYVVTALIDGKEVTLDTVALNDATIDISDGFLTLYKFTLNEDKEIVALDNASCFAVNDIEDEFGDYDVAFMTNATLDGIKTVFDGEDLLYITEKSGNLLDVGAYDEDDVHNKDFQSVDGAVFYQVKLDGQTPVVEVAALRDVKKGYLAGLFQTDEDAAAWNIVVFVNPEDFELGE